MYAQSTPLHLACEMGDIKMVKFILRYLDVSCYRLDFVKDQRGNTPILLAAESGHENIVKILIPFYDNPRVKGMSGWSSLTAAALKGHLEVVKLLSYDLKFKEDLIQDLINCRFHAKMHKHNSVVEYCHMKLEYIEQFDHRDEEEILLSEY